MLRVGVFLYTPAGKAYQYWWGHAYPDNHVYRALLAANAKVQTGQITQAKRYVEVYDITDDFRRAVSGEPFHQLVDEFSELGMKLTGMKGDRYYYAPVSGKEYYLGLHYRELSTLKIPDTMFWPGIPPPDYCCPDFEIRITYNSDTDYEVIKATIENNSDTL
jgi:hypothetical protein